MRTEPDKKGFNTRQASGAEPVAKGNKCSDPIRVRHDCIEGTHQWRKSAKSFFKKR